MTSVDARHMAFEIGAQARYEGIQMSQCPFVGDDPDSRQAASDWCDGWIAAEADIAAAIQRAKERP